jgi:hypothetical protein
MTEYGATCLYLWLAIHSTGTLQQVFQELIEDEVNHLTKFWGFGLWLFPANHIQYLARNFKQLLPRKSQGSLLRTYRRMMGVLQWKYWQVKHRAELVYVFLLVIHSLWIWHQTLTHENLDRLFGNVNGNEIR